MWNKTDESKEGVIDQYEIHRSVWNSSIRKLLLFIYKSGVYWWENKNNQWKNIMNLIQTTHPNRIAFHTSKQGTSSAEAEARVSVFENSVTEPKPKSNLFRCKNINLATFNVWTFNTINHEHLPRHLSENLRQWHNKRVEMFLSLHALKSRNSVEKTQP